MFCMNYEQYNFIFSLMATPILNIMFSFNLNSKPKFDEYLEIGIVQQQQKRFKLLI